IRTIARKGLRFVADVRMQPAGDAAAQAAARPPEHVHAPPHQPQAQAQASHDRPIIAGLPFVNTSGDPEQEHLSRGIHAGMMPPLSELRWFLVIARNSSFIYKGKAIHIKQVADELGAGYVVEGSVRKGGDRVRITAQLNDVVTGSHLWAERYDRDLSDVFAV